MYLSYFDDSGSEPSSDLCVFGGVVVPGNMIGHAEAWSNVAIQMLGKDFAFKEFKASELYYGSGAFQGIDKDMCRSAFHALIDMLAVYKIPFIYSAVDRKALQGVPLFGSSHPVDTAFRMCLGELENWARAREKQFPSPLSIQISFDDMCLVIADECDGNLKKQMLATFRTMRPKGPVDYTSDLSKRLWHIHDAMYFGASVDSIGLQLADAANWSMKRLLRGDKLDIEVERTLRRTAVCAKPEPEWTAHRNLFRDHADVLPTSADAV